MEKWAHVFILGISLNEILKDNKAILPYLNLIACLIIELFTVPISRFLFVVIVMVMCFVSVKTEFKFKYDKIINFVAEISFPLYLVHQKVGFIIIQCFENRAIGIVTEIVISIIAAYLIHRYIEKPLILIFTG